jgi:hypothetical protein
MNAPQRKLLFILFSDDACRLNHALRYAIDLHQRGTATVQVIIEGPVTAVLGKVQDQSSTTAQLLRKTIDLGLVAGACRTASAGCSTGDPERQVTEAVSDLGLALLGDLDGHAAVEPYVRDGYELIPF